MSLHSTSLPFVAEWCDRRRRGSDYGVFADDKWALRKKIDGAEYIANATEFRLNGIATMPYPSNHILIWGTALFHR